MSCSKYPRRQGTSGCQGPGGKEWWQVEGFCRVLSLQDVFFYKKTGITRKLDRNVYSIYIYIYTKIIWRHSLRRYFGHKRTATIFSFRSRPDFTDRGTRAGDPFRWGECATQQCCQYCWHRKCGRRPWGLGMSFSKLVVGMVFVWKKIIMCFYDFCSVGQHLVGRVLPFAPSQKGGSSFFDPRVIAIQLPLPFPQPAQYKCVRAALGTYNAKREELRWKTESTIDRLVYATQSLLELPRNFVYEK